MFRIEKTIACVMSTLFVVLILLSSVGQVILPTYSLWFNQVEDGKALAASGFGEWKTTLESWQWVDKFYLKWTFPGYVQINLTAKQPVLKIAEDEYIDQKGIAFKQSNQLYHLPLAQIDPSAYSEISHWVAYFQQSQLKLDRIEQKPSNIIDFYFSSGGVLSLYGPRVSAQKWVLPVISSLMNGQHCYLYSRESVACNR